MSSSHKSFLKTGDCGLILQITIFTFKENYFCCTGITQCSYTADPNHPSTPHTPYDYLVGHLAWAPWPQAPPAWGLGYQLHG